MTTQSKETVFGRRPRVRAAQTGGGYGLFATEAVAAGEWIVRIEGEVRSRPSRFSIQIGQDRHIDVSEGSSLEEMLANHCWWFVNHCCEPNATIRDREIVAVRAIGAGEEVTFSYVSTELELAETFVCRCGTMKRS